MNLFHHDTTGTETDSARPLSRKKLRSLMYHNRAALTGGALAFKTKGARPSMQMRIAKRVEEKAARLSEAEQKREAALILAGVPATERGLDDADKPNIFKRMSGMFADMTKRFQRGQAKGK